MLEWYDGGDSSYHHAAVSSSSDLHSMLDDMSTSTTTTRSLHRHQPLVPLSTAASHPFDHHHRLLAGGDEPQELYYGTLSVAVLTLGLLLLVEACRRQLDRSAVNRPIFQAVLDGVYRELATLGIVELFIHLLHEYYDNLDTAAESVFVDVHFVLFYTAIFNALQSVILAVFAHRVSYATWVRTEELELNHYVEIREEFDRVRAELFDDSRYQQQHPSQHNSTTTGGNATERSTQPPSSRKSWHSVRRSLHRSTLEFYDSNGATVWDSIRSSCVGIYYYLKYPRLKAKHDELLVQVRFHEMRVHFLQSYDLPLKLKVSTYLMRSEQQVIKHLIHVSTSAWLWLTGLISVLYFTTGVITDITGDQNSADVTVSVFFFVQMLLFIFISVWLYRGMQSIFMQIMEMKHLWDISSDAADDDDNNNNNNNNKIGVMNGETHSGDGGDDVREDATSRRFADTDLSSSLAAEQLNLFFLGDPKIVVIAIQFMQFGYAIAVAVIVVFWENMNSGGIFSARVYLITTLVCYIVYVIVTAQMLPKYTMCTSLGQLVDRKRLHETVAVFRLEEAERRRRQRKEVDMHYYLTAAANGNHDEKNNQNNNNTKSQNVVPIEQQRGDFIGDNNNNGIATHPMAAPAPFTATMPSITEGVVSNGNANEAPALLPLPSQDMIPGSMETNTGVLPLLSDVKTAAAVTTGTSRPSSNTVSMPIIDEGKAAIEPEKADLLVDLVKMDTKSLRERVPLEDIRKAERRDRRRNRRKSVSDGVALMSAVGNISGFFGGGNTTEEASTQKSDHDRRVSAPQRPKTDVNLSLTGGTHTPAQFAVDDSALLKRKERRRNRKKAVSASASIQQMRDFQGGGGGEDKKQSDDIFATWKNKDALRKPSPLVDETKPEVVAQSTATVAPTTAPATFPPLKDRLFGAADDSIVGGRLQQQRQQRRRTRKKALSASAAVKLMQAGHEYDSNETALEQESMMEFWGISRDKAMAVRGETDDAAMKELDRGTATNVQVPKPQMLMPVREASEDMDHSFSNNHHMDQIVLSPAESLSPSVFITDEQPGSFVNGDQPTKTGSENDNDSGFIDDDTVETDRSVGGLSHVGDADDYNYQRYASFLEEEEVERISCSARLARLNNRLRRFFLSKSYTFVTHMLGTTLGFFLIGMRVEGFLKEQCIIPEDDHSWDMALYLDFWFVFTWLLLFLLVSAYKIFLFPAFSGKETQEYFGEEIYGSKREHWIIFLAASFDIFISFASLIIFLGAEIERCCDGEEYPIYEDSQSTNDYGYSDKQVYGEDLAYNSTSSDNYTGTYYDQDADKSYYEPAKGNVFRFLAGDYDSQAEIKACKDSTAYCNCPQFGKRLSGGLGNVEPWAALFVLRVFRFLVARLIVQKLDLGRDLEKEGQEEIGKSRRSVAAASTHYGGHGGKGGEFKNGTIVELWQAAISEHPEIVEKFGEFSGELLQAMLGVDIFESNFVPPAETKKGPVAVPSTPIGSEGARSLSRGFPSSTNLEEAATNTEHITLDEKRYCKLAPEVQEIIVAGKLGMPVKFCGNLHALSPSSHSLASLEKNAGGDGPLEFEVDVAQMELDQFESVSQFEFPYARLVRSMRRCERKLLPLLDTWSPVDVILTKHEMVYISCESNDAGNNNQLQDAGRLALKATKGGKGLRLCDVTAGRRVIGQLSFSEILSIHVERKYCQPGSIVRSADEATAELAHGHVEFWQESFEDDRAESPVDIQKRFESVNQDALKIKTIHGTTLYLRFLSDLEDSEAHPERVADELDVNNPLYKDISLQWAQTIVRQCNVGQLHQPLPHFGTNDNDELKDLLQIVHRDETRHHRRFSSAGIRDLYYNPKSFHRRQSAGKAPRLISSALPLSSNIFDTASDMELGTTNNSDEHPLKQAASPAQIPRPRKFTRFGSSGDIDIVDDNASSSLSSKHRAKSIG